MFDRILLVCTGNICRSPMAEALLKAQFPNREVQSAGVGAVVGAGADPEVLRLVRERGLNLDAHRARQVNERMLSAFDLVLVMDRSHSEWLNRRYPQHRGRVHKLLKWSDDGDVVDPYGHDSEVFRSVLSVIDKGLRDWAGRL